jgi:hypothetical protein
VPPRRRASGSGAAQLTASASRRGRKMTNSPVRVGLTAKDILGFRHDAAVATATQCRTTTVPISGVYDSSSAKARRIWPAVDTLTESESDGPTVAIYGLASAFSRQEGPSAVRTQVPAARRTIRVASWINRTGSGPNCIARARP